MVLDKYIGDLLYRYECVIVPGFGGFITNKVSAKNVSSQHKFFPPTKEIAFNRNLNQNDGLLANYLVQAKKISYTHAVELIETSVADWQTLLDEDNTFDIKKIGSFSLNEESNLTFTPFDDVNYLTESYGLSAFTSLAIKRAGEKAKVKPLNGEQSVSNSVSIRKYVRYAAVLIPFIAIGALSFYQMKTGSSVPVSNATINIIPENTFVEDKKVEAKEDTPKAENKVIVANKETPKPVVIEQKVLKYHVISGAFSKKKNAEKEIRLLKKKGLDAEVLGTNKNGLYMVSFKSFDNVGDASKFAKTIKARGYKGTWVWKNIIK